MTNSFAFRRGDRLVYDGQVVTMTSDYVTVGGAHRIVFRRDDGFIDGEDYGDKFTRAVTITLPERVAQEHAERMADSLRTLSSGDFPSDEIGEREIEDGWFIVNAIKAALGQA